MALYDTIGKTYDETRKADPQIVQELVTMLQLPRGGRLLDIGCGSGNYTVALHGCGMRCVGVDISEEMLSKARQKSTEIEWVHGDACKLPFKSEQFDGASCILATHHIKNLSAAFGEALRVLRHGARLVLFTTTVEQMQKYWLWEYFPGIMKRACQEIEVLGRQDEKLKLSGFHAVFEKAFSVTNALVDRFLQSGKNQPAIYLDPAVRSGISSFARHGYEEEVKQGVEKLRSDIETKQIDKIIQQYESELGDYLFIEAIKE